MYAIVQEIDGALSVVGNSHRLYESIDDAKDAWADVAHQWYEEVARVHGSGQPLGSWTENPPKLIDLSNKNVICPTSDVRAAFIDLYNKHQYSQDALYSSTDNQSAALRSEYKDSAKSLLLGST